LSLPELGSQGRRRYCTLPLINDEDFVVRGFEARVILRREDAQQVPSLRRITLPSNDRWAMKSIKPLRSLSPE
jgi:hypothetical protein